ncbi:MAG TPA: S-layer homology domain-containing protein [Acidimicrobiia bacterium]
MPARLRVALTSIAALLALPVAATGQAASEVPPHESLFEDDELSLLGEDAAYTAAIADPRVVCLPDAGDPTAPLVEFVFVTADPKAKLPEKEMVATAAWVDHIFAESADIHAPGSFRAVRWAQEQVGPDRCLPKVRKVVVDRAGFRQWARPDGSWSRFRSSIVDALGGTTSTPRRFLVWADLEKPGYCGHGEMPVDTRPDPKVNVANRFTQIAVVYAGCHGRVNATEAHELIHTFGAVLPVAPNAADAHCEDHFDRMCVGKAGQAICDDVWRRLLDCGGDDYFNPGRPLVGRNGKQYWNTADSVFLTSDRPAWWPTREAASQEAAGSSSNASEPTTRNRETTANGQRFTDSAGHVFETEIAVLTKAGITRGCAPDRFCPDQPVTRGQMAAFLARALHLPPANTTFTDTKGHTFATDIAALARSGVTRGCAPDRFCPDQPVTRGQMAAFLVRALPLGE